jgi:ubiquinone biosynthesis protein
VLARQDGEPLDQAFAEFDPQPLGSASLAQVHAARLMDGRSVVVKVQRPDIRRTIESDLDILFGLARLAQRSALGQLVQPVEVVSRFADTLRSELDYRQEGLNIERFQAQFIDEKQLHVPQVL